MVASFRKVGRPTIWLSRREFFAVARAVREALGGGRAARL
jgi:hypothetical protein